MRTRIGKLAAFGIMRGAIAILIMVRILGAAQGALAQAGGDAALSAAEATKLLPASVYFKGQSATTQQKYQAYFITEIPIKIEGHELAAGIYGVGFVGGDKFVVLDVGAHDLFTVSSHTDAELKRPMPLKVTAEKDGFRLFEGRRYVTFAR